MVLVQTWPTSSGSQAFSSASAFAFTSSSFVVQPRDSLIASTQPPYSSLRRTAVIVGLNTLSIAQCSAISSVLFQKPQARPAR